MDAISYDDSSPGKKRTRDESLATPLTKATEL